jgi:hypothetical protein
MDNDFQNEADEAAAEDEAIGRIEKSGIDNLELAHDEANGNHGNETAADVDHIVVRCHELDFRKVVKIVGPIRTEF